MTVCNILLVGMNKGGVGKSHVCLNLGTLFASGLANKGKSKKPKKVLLVDLDPQANLSDQVINIARNIKDDFEQDIGDVRVMLEENNFAMSYELITQAVTDEEEFEILDRQLFRPSQDLELYCLIGKGKDATAYHEAKNDSPIEVAARMRNRLDALIEKEGFDLVIIDSPPGETQVEMLASMHVCSDLLIPANWNDGSSSGLQTMAEIVKAVREERLLNGDDLNIAGILMNLAPQSKEQRDFSAHIEKRFPIFASRVLSTALYRYQPWEKCSNGGILPWEPSKLMAKPLRTSITSSLRHVAFELQENMSAGYEYADIDDSKVG